MNQKIKALASIELAQGGTGTCKTGYQPIPNINSESKWKMYERYKKLIQNAGFTPSVYEEKMRHLTDMLGI